MAINHPASKWKKQDLNPGSLAMPVPVPSSSQHAGPTLSCPLLGLSSDLLDVCFPLEMPSVAKLA